MIKKIVITIFILNLLFLTAGCSGNLSNTAVLIGNEKITTEEFIFAANVCKSETILYFSSKYNVADVSSDDFWNSTFGEEKEKPIDVLKEKALEFLKHSHTVFSLSKEQGIIADNSFKSIKKMFQEENENRKTDDIVLIYDTHFNTNTRQWYAKQSFNVMYDGKVRYDKHGEVQLHLEFYINAGEWMNPRQDWTVEIKRIWEMEDKDQNIN